jgi:hypothetical protein
MVEAEINRGKAMHVVDWRRKQSILPHQDQNLNSDITSE